MYMKTKQNNLLCETILLTFTDIMQRWNVTGPATGHAIHDTDERAVIGNGTHSPSIYDKCVCFTSPMFNHTDHRNRYAHCNKLSVVYQLHDVETLPYYWPFVRGTQSPSEFPHKRPCNPDLGYIFVVSLNKLLHKQWSFWRFRRHDAHLVTL